MFESNLNRRPPGSIYVNRKSCQWSVCTPLYGCNSYTAADGQYTYETDHTDTFIMFPKLNVREENSWFRFSCFVWIFWGWQIQNWNTLKELQARTVFICFNKVLSPTDVFPMV